MVECECLFCALCLNPVERQYADMAQAPGEAEAELAVMNRQGKIDAVLSDDVDALLFGATCLLRK